MNLYAKTTSERASKGQGGNKELVIDLTIDDKRREEVGTVVMSVDNGAYSVLYYPKDNKKVVLYKSQEKQKGEK